MLKLNLQNSLNNLFLPKFTQFFNDNLHRGIILLKLYCHLNKQNTLTFRKF